MVIEKVTQLHAPTRYDKSNHVFSLGDKKVLQGPTRPRAWGTATRGPAVWWQECWRAISVQQLTFLNLQGKAIDCIVTQFMSQSVATFYFQNIKI